MYWLLAVGFFSNVIHLVPWSIIFLFTKWFSIQLYSLTREEECSVLQRRIGNESFSEVGNNKKGQGYAIGKWFLIHISYNHGEYRVWLLATKASYEKLTADLEYVAPTTSCIEDAPLPPPPSKVSIVERLGPFINPWLRKRDIMVTITPRQDQKDIIDKIIEHQNAHGHTVIYLWGEPGKGKSMIGVILAKQLNGLYCNTLKLWQPNDNIQTLYFEQEITKDCPLVLVFDEVDAVLKSVHEEAIPEHKNLPTAVRNKTGWNNMLDQIQRGMHPNLILIMTSNKSPTFIREMDPSYIRDGRVNMVLEL